MHDGIDLRVTGGRTGIKYEFVVAPGADWRQVRVHYEGIERLTLREDAGLVASRLETKPKICQKKRLPSRSPIL